MGSFSSPLSNNQPGLERSLLNSQQKETGTLRILEMSGLGCQVTTCFEARFGVSLGGSDVSIGGGDGFLGRKIRGVSCFSLTFHKNISSVFLFSSKNYELFGGFSRSGTICFSS